MVCKPACAFALAGALAAADNHLLAERVASGECAESSVTRASWFDSKFHIGNFPSAEVTQAEDLSTYNMGSDWSQVEMLIDYGSNFKLATDHISKEVYVLTQCGTTKPSDAQVNAVRSMPTGYARKDFTIPVKSVIATGTTQLHFLDALGLKDRVTHITQYAVGSCWQKGRADCDAALEGAYGNASLRESQFATADLVLLNCNTAWDGPNYCNSYSKDGNCACTIVNDQPNGVHFASTTAVAGNLNTAEYIKWLALFFNKEREAKAYFATMSTSYSAAAAAASNGAKKKVAWVSYSAASQWSPQAKWDLSSAVYKAELVAAAGGEMVNGDAIMAQIENMTKSVDWVGNPKWTIATDAFTGETDAAGQLMDALKNANVDIIIDETYSYDTKNYAMTNFKSNYKLSSTDMQILRIDGTVSAAGDLDWYESRIANPHQAVQGLQRLMLPDSALPKWYFRDISAGEAVDEIAASDCTETLPFCDSATNASAIPMLISPPGEVSAARGAAAPFLAAAIAIAAAGVAAWTA